MSATEVPHPDTVLLDEMTRWLNARVEPSGADTLDELCRLIAHSGRPLLPQTLDLDADVTVNRFGIPTASIHAGPYAIRVRQRTDGLGELHVAINTPDPGDDAGLVITVNDHRVVSATSAPVPTTSTGTDPISPPPTQETRP